MAMKNIRRMLFALYSWLFAGLDILVPKKDSVYLIASHTGLTGNPRFFAQHLLEHADAKLYFIVPEKSAAQAYFQQQYGHRVKFLKYRNSSTLFLALRAGQVFISHDLYRDVGFPLRRFGTRRLVVNLWHGIASKKHWLLSKEKVVHSFAARSRQFSAIVASSSADAVAKAGVFGKGLEDLWITGTPRNDYLVTEPNPLVQDLAEQHQAMRAKIKDRALVLYAPTWRKFQTDFLPFTEQDIQQLTELLTEHNAVLGLRLHSKDEEKFTHLYASDSVVNLGSKQFPETQVVLRNTQLLITDYSSIWMDYLLLSRPVLAYWYDYKNYKQRMGIIWDMPSLFPGKIAFSFAELLSEIKGVLEAGLTIPAEYNSQYKYSRLLFHRFADGRNNQRLLNRIEDQKRGES